MAGESESGPASGMPPATKLVFGLLVIGGLAALGWYTFRADEAPPPGPGADVVVVGSMEVSADYFVGTWTTKSCSGTIYTTFHADGTYSGRMVRRDGRVAKYINGSWRLDSGKLIWVHGSDTSRTKRGYEDVNPIVSAGQNSFSVKETNGRRTSFQRER